MPSIVRLSSIAIALAATVALAACGQKTTKASSEPNPVDLGKALAFASGDAALQWGPCPSIMPAGCEIAVLRGDPAKPNADIYLRVPAGAEIPAHSHTSAERMILVSGELDVTYQGHAPSKLKVGSYAYGPAKLAHKATCVGADPCTLFIAFELPIDATAHEGAL